MITINKYTSTAVDRDLLSVHNVDQAGDVVSAETWVALWELVFATLIDHDAHFKYVYDRLTDVVHELDKHDNRLTTLEAQYASLNERFTVLENTWDALQESYNAIRAAQEGVIAKYEALNNSFIHYGKTAPTNEHIKLWVMPTAYPITPRSVEMLRAELIDVFGILEHTQDLIASGLPLKGGAYSLGSGEYKDLTEATLVPESKCTEKLAVNVGDVYIVSGASSIHYCGITAYKEDGTTVVEQFATKLTFEPEPYLIEYTIPTGVAYIACCTVDNVNHPLKITRKWTSYKPVIDTVSEAVNAWFNNTTVAETINAWLDAHPEATTSIKDGSIELFKIKGCLTPQMFGAVGDGNTDDSEAIQKMIDAAEPGMRLVFPKGTYIIHPYACLGYRLHSQEVPLAGASENDEGSVYYKHRNVYSNFGVVFYKKHQLKIEFEPGAILKSIKNNFNSGFQASYFFDLVYCTDIEISGGEFIGDIDDIYIDKNNPSDLKGERVYNQTGISICSCENVVVKNVHAHNWRSGCINVGGNPKSKNILIDSCDVHDSNYHALVVEGADNVTVRNVKARWADTGTASSFGTAFDCEGVSALDPNRNIVIEGCTFGYAQTSSLNIIKCDNVVVRDCTITDKPLTVQGYCSNITVQNNNCTEAAIRVYGNAQRNIVIDGNTLHNGNLDFAMRRPAYSRVTALSNVSNKTWQYGELNESACTNLRIESLKEMADAEYMSYLDRLFGGYVTGITDKLKSDLFTLATPEQLDALKEHLGVVELDAATWYKYNYVKFQGHTLKELRTRSPKYFFDLIVSDDVLFKNNNVLFDAEELPTYIDDMGYTQIKLNKDGEIDYKRNKVPCISTYIQGGGSIKVLNNTCTIHDGSATFINAASTTTHNELSVEGNSFNAGSRSNPIQLHMYAYPFVFMRANIMFTRNNVQVYGADTFTQYLNNGNKTTVRFLPEMYLFYFYDDKYGVKAQHVFTHNNVYVDTPACNVPRMLLISGVRYRQTAEEGQNGFAFEDAVFDANTIEQFKVTIGDRILKPEEYTLDVPTSGLVLVTLPEPVKAGTHVYLSYYHPECGLFANNTIKANALRGAYLFGGFSTYGIKLYNNVFEAPVTNLYTAQLFQSVKNIEIKDPLF